MVTTTTTTTKTSEARRNANRRNAQRSTGPKTDAGKQQTRANAIKHGLTSVVVVAPEEAQVLNDRLNDWAPNFPAENSNDCWIREQMILATVRIDRCQEQERLQRAFEADRALFCWDIDQDCQAETLGARIGKYPSKIAAELRCSRAGVDWLLRRWDKLAAMLDNCETFEDDQRQLVLNLLGEPIETRPADLADLAAETAEELRALIRSEVEFLQGLREDALTAMDIVERQMAEAGSPASESPEIRRFRRYEADLWKRYEKAKAAWEARATQQASEPTTKQAPEQDATKLIEAMLVEETETETETETKSLEVVEILSPQAIEPARVESIVSTPSTAEAPKTSKQPKPLNRKQRKALQKHLQRCI